MNARADEMLDDLVGLNSLGIAPLPSQPPRQAIIKISYTHDAMIDLIIARPEISNNDLAAHFGYTPSWISTIRHTDAFKAKLASRRSEVVDPELITSVELRFKGLASRSLEILQEKLNQPSAEVSDQTALRALELSSRALGYGAAAGPQVNVQVNVETHLEKMGDNLTKLLQRRKEQAVSGNLPVPMEDEGDE